MALLKRINLSEKAFIILWRIEESLDWIETRVQLNNREQEYYRKVTNESRKQEWLMVRFLLQKEFGIQAFISYNNEGKPLLNNVPGNISLTHSNKLVGLYYHPEKQVGIDIEYFRNRVERVSGRFLSKEELDAVTPYQRIEQLTVMWAVKESLTKWFGKKHLVFNEEIIIEPFKLLESGLIRARIKCQELHRYFKLQYTITEDFAVVYVVE